MLSTTRSGVYVDQTAHEMLLGKFNGDKTGDKKYKEEILKKIVAANCAMLNCNGGKVVINIDDACNVMSASQVLSVARIVEQHLIHIIGININKYVDFEEDLNTVTIFIKKAASLITVNYHLYIASQTQVLLVPPAEAHKKIRDDFIKRNVIDEAVQLESHEKTFLSGKSCGISETKTVQLKNLKSASSKRRKLADRVIDNKFSCYVSAFANYNGGHIYYGIDDDGIVAGESIPNELDKGEITKKVEKSINNMVWPEQPKRKVHWEIFFEPVFDNNSAPIPSTFVIVIYVAPCLGGVFTEEPECYEMVEGKVVKMSFTTWKKRILQPIVLFHLPIIPSIGKRATWGSSTIQKVCSQADELLVTTINNGNSIQTISNSLIKDNPNLVELKLLILAKNIMASYRSSSFKAAREMLDVYETSLRAANEFWMFDAIRVYLEAAICSVQGDVEAVDNILPKALDQAGAIKPGRISAAIYLLAGMNLLQQKGDDDNSSVLFITRALEHLKHVEDLPKVRADMEQKAHILLALFYLGCNRAGVPTKKHIDTKCLKKVKSSIVAVQQSIGEGNQLNPYRELQFCLVQSILFYRKSQVEPDRKMLFLKEAFDTSKKAETLATAGNFQEMVTWSRGCVALFAEDLLSRFSTSDFFRAK